jgi:hypothetical protein
LAFQFIELRDASAELRIEVDQHDTIDVVDFDGDALIKASPKSLCEPLHPGAGLEASEKVSFGDDPLTPHGD